MEILYSFLVQFFGLVCGQAIGVFVGMSLYYHLRKGYADKCPECENGLVWDAEYDTWFACSICKGTGVAQRKTKEKE